MNVQVFRKALAASKNTESRIGLVPALGASTNKLELASRGLSFASNDEKDVLHVL